MTNNFNNTDDFDTQIQSDEFVYPWVDESCHGVTSDDALLQNALRDHVLDGESVDDDACAIFSPDDPDNYDPCEDGDCDGPDAADPGDLVFDSESGEWYEPCATGRDAH